MTGQEMLDLLALRLEDASKKNFSDWFKLEALNSAQLRLANLLNHAYLTELEVLQSNLAVSSGATATLDSTNLTSTYSVLNGGQGILKVQDYNTNIYLTRVELDDLKRNENSLIVGTVQNPLYFVFQNKIYTLPTSITYINFWYLRNPLPIYRQYTASGGTGTPTWTITCADADLSTTENYYNDAVIWNITTARYHKINDFVSADGTGTFTVDNPGSGTPGTNGDKFYILTHDFETAHQEDASCELSEDLHEIILDLAEAECWTVDDDKDRRAAALSNAYSEIKTLNERVEKPEGIGTVGDRRYAAGLRAS